MLVEAAVLAAQMTVVSSTPPLSPEQAVAVLRACCVTPDGLSLNVPPVYPTPPPSIVLSSQAGEGPFGPFPPYRTSSWQLPPPWWPGAYWGPLLSATAAFAPWLGGGAPTWWRAMGGAAGTAFQPASGRASVTVGSSAIGAPGAFVRSASQALAGRVR